MPIRDLEFASINALDEKKYAVLSQHPHRLRNISTILIPKKLLGFITDILNEREKKKKRQKRYEQRKQYYANKYKHNNSRPPTNWSAYPKSNSNVTDPTPRFKTLKGEMVRSLSEKFIADFLFTHNVAYEYEKHIKLDNWELKPDFYLTTYNIYIEFWGMLNDPNYFQNFQSKVEKYNKHHIKFIALNQDDLPNIERNFPIKLQIALGARK